MRKHKSKPRRKSQGNQTGQENSTSTDSEAGAVDSDSGYYSPKHARTNIGVTTHDAATGPQSVMHDHRSAGAGSNPSAMLSHNQHQQVSHPEVGRPMYHGMLQHRHPHLHTHPHPHPPTNYPPPPQHPMMGGAPPPLQPPPPHMQQQTMSYARILSQAPPRPTPAMPPPHVRNIGQGDHHARHPVQPPMANMNNSPKHTRSSSPQHRGGRVNTQGTNFTKNSSTATAATSVDKADPSGSTSKRKKKKQRKQKGGGGDESSSIDGVKVHNQRAEPPPLIQDPSDFPELPTGFGKSGRNGGGMYQQQQSPASYSAILQQKAPLRKSVSMKD